MTLSKKRLALITVALTIIFFIPMLYLPESIIGSRADHMLIFAPKILFLAMTAALVIAFILAFIIKCDFMKWQAYSFNRFKHLLKLLVKRDFIAKYRKSVLGVLWSLLNPILTMLVMTMVFAHVFRFGIEDFPVYFLSGLLIFNFFSESTTAAMGSILSNEGIIRKVYVPKYIFPVARVLSSLVNLAFSFIAFLVVFVFTGQQFQWTMLLIPIPVIYTFLFALGMAMFLSSLAVFFRDLTYLYGVILTLWQFMTPIIYPVEIIPERFRPIYGLNPMYHFVDYFRELVLHGRIPDLWSNIVCIGFALASLCIGTYVFMSKQDRYILYM
ncbi:MAG: ABC transporter permease [Oscillospiraceae bacterium]|nr:ABC transporter permease [Oscillospiraceae bacterium]